MGAAVGKEFVQFFTSPTAAVLKLLAKTLCQQHRKAVGKEFFHFFVFFFPLFCGSFQL
jgi:hypothetical protein